MAKLILLTIAILCTITSTYGYQRYQSEIPNGNQVPNPCSPGNTWPGVGHQAVNGGGLRNPFGAAFAAAGRTWSMALCQADSDGDGMANGVELGDPDCMWAKGGSPNMTTGLSHPGVCTPVNAAACIGKQPWLSCGVAANTTTSTAAATTATQTTNGAPQTFTYHSIFIVFSLIACALW